jgi:hypothetical protein
MNLSFMIFVCLAMTSSASAGLIIDQQNDAPTGTTVSCGPGVVLFQTFTPTASTLDLVRLTFRPGGGFPPSGYETSITIRSGDPYGPELGSSSAIAEGEIGGAMDVYFWFPSLPLTPGTTYVIEWTEPPESAVVMSWFWTEDTYAGGNAGSLWSPEWPPENYLGADWLFATYYENGEPPAKGPITTQVSVWPNPVAVNGWAWITAKVDDITTGGSNIVSAEYSLDGSTWIAMTPRDGSWDEMVEGVEAYFFAPSVPGVCNLCVRGTDALANVSDAVCILLDVSGGPVTWNVSVTPNPSISNGTVTLTATVDDSSTGGSTIASAECSLDGVTWTLMSPQDGAFDEVMEDVVGTLTAPSSRGYYYPCVRGTDALSEVGVPSYVELVVYEPGDPIPDVGRPITSNVVVTPNPVPINSLMTVTAKVDDTTTGGSNILLAWWIMEGGGWTPMVASDGAFDEPNEAVTATFTAPSEPGFYTVGVYGMDIHENWSDTVYVGFEAYDPGGGPDTKGPVTSKVKAVPNPAPADGSVMIVAKVNDGNTGGSLIASAECSLDGGVTWTPMDPQDGAFDAVSEDVMVLVVAPSFPDTYLVLVRGTDALGNVGKPKNTFLTVYLPSPSAEGCVIFDDHFDDFSLDPGWSVHYATDGEVYEKISEEGSMLVLAADGTDIWTDNDEYVAVYRSVEGDFEAIAEVKWQAAVNEWSKTGLAVRNNMSQNGSPDGPGSLGYAGIFVTPEHGYTFQWDAGDYSTSVDSLRAHPDFPDNPNGWEPVSDGALRGPVDWADCYGQRISGMMKAPKTGNYLFRIASDDSSELWLSTDTNPENVQLIAQVLGWTDPAEYDKYPEQYSEPIWLNGGEIRYVEVLHREGGGGDHVSVQWLRPDVASNDWRFVKGTFVREWWTWSPNGFLDSNVEDGWASYPCWLKLTKSGKDISGSYSTSGPNGPWTGVGGATLEDAQTTQDVGMMATSHLFGRVGYNSFGYFALLLPDTMAPDLWLQVNPTVLWPPNHKMVEIAPEWTVWDAYDSSPKVTLKSIIMTEGDDITTYEPVEEPQGHGNKAAGDMYVDPDGRIFLRAERSGANKNRIYMITFSAVDFCGNATTRSVLVVVPHDQALEPADVTSPGDPVRGVPNDGDWPAMEAPPNAIDNDVTTKYLHFKGAMQPTGFQVQPAIGPTIINEMTFTTADDAPERDPVQFEVYGATERIDGPYTLIASGGIPDFAGATEWPRLTRNSTPSTFPNETAYRYYQVLFPAVRDPASANSMQIAEVELIGRTVNVP